MELWLVPERTLREKARTEAVYAQALSVIQQAKRQGLEAVAMITASGHISVHTEKRD